MHAVCTILKNIMASAAETEIAAAFINSQEVMPIRYAVEFLGHKQPRTPMQVDNTTAVGFTNNTIKQKKSKAIEMRFYWLRDRESQDQFSIYWHQGVHNMGDYFTKKNSPATHISKRAIYLHEADDMANCMTLIKSFAPLYHAKCARV